MYCRHCGRELPDTAVFCAYCGKSTMRPDQRATQSTNRGASQGQGGMLVQANRIAERFVPVRLAKRFPTIMPVLFIGIYGAVLLIVVIAVSSIAGAFNHDLSGTYSTYEFFPVNTITFQKNGSFTAVSYAGYTETYQGKYSKSLNGEYTLRFTGGSANGGSPVTQYEASTVGQQYELAVEKVSENTLKAQVVPKIGYYAWSGTAVYFYKN